MDRAVCPQLLRFMTGDLMAQRGRMFFLERPFPAHWTFRSAPVACLAMLMALRRKSEQIPG